MKTRAVLFILLVAIALMSCKRNGKSTSESNDTQEPKKKELGNLDTLLIQVYNPALKEIDIERDFLPPYLDELDVEITDVQYPARKRHLENGKNRSTKYSFSFAEATHVDENDGKWYDRWTLEIDKYDSIKDAVLEFNKHIKGLDQYNAEGVKHQGNDSRRFLSAATIILVSGSCRTPWFVKDGFNRILKMHLGTGQPAPKTVITTFCGSGATNDYVDGN